MADPTVADPDLPDFSSFPLPSLDTSLFSQHLSLTDHDPNNTNPFYSFDENDAVDFDFDFSLDYLNSVEFLNTSPIDPPGTQIPSESDGHASFVPRSPEPELRQISNSNPPDSHDRRSSSVLNPTSPEICLISDNECWDVSRYLNVPSSDSVEFISESANNGLTNCDGQVSSQGSGNCGSNASEALNYSSPDSGNSSSPNFANNSVNDVADQEIKLEENDGKNCLLKRKKENEDTCIESRTSKYSKSNNVQDSINDEDDKRNARLMRNRESAQLSRQRKKHYVEELEDKLRTMHSTIQDLNAKVSYMMAENASLRQQLGGNGMCAPPPPPPPGVGMYPHMPMPPMVYPWMPCPPYVVKPQGSQVPLVPIPRLKPQQPVSAPKAKTKKLDNKKSEGKTKKVASVSFLGLLFFILLFGGLVPMVNVKYGGMKEAFTGGSDYVGNRVFSQHRGRGRVLTVNGHLNGTGHNVGIRSTNEKCGVNGGRGHVAGTEENVEQKGGGSHHLLGSDEFDCSGNASDTLLASLYVPRNDKLVKIDGNLIIHSVMASEKAMASREDTRMKRGSETGLAVPGNLAPGIPSSGVGRNSGRHPHLYRSPTERQKAIASGSAGKDNLKSSAADGKLQQWFQEGLAGPLLSSGMCTEVFQFDVSPAAASGAIIPATSVRNVSVENSQNSSYTNKGRNRRILNGLPIPLPGSSHNITEEHRRKTTENENFRGNNSLSSMVVSVLVDPREAGDSDGDGMMGPKSLSRIFVVVLIDSVKYVTYSCILPLMGSGPHLVTT